MTLLGESAKKIKGLLNKFCDAGDKQNDEEMKEYAEDIQAFIEDVASMVGTDVTDAFLDEATRLIGRPVRSYYEQAMRD